MKKIVFISSVPKDLWVGVQDKKSTGRVQNFTEISTSRDLCARFYRQGKIAYGQYFYEIPW